MVGHAVTQCQWIRGSSKTTGAILDLRVETLTLRWGKFICSSRRVHLPQPDFATPQIFCRWNWASTKLGEPVPQPGSVSDGS